jgi:hypothetical protein
MLKNMGDSIKQGVIVPKTMTPCKHPYSQKRCGGQKKAGYHAE